MKRILVYILFFIICVNQIKAQSLWGLRSSGGDGYGTVFNFAAGNNTYTTLYNLKGYGGIGPSGKLLQASNGKIYGFTQNGGACAPGGVFYEYNPVTQTFSTIVNMSTAATGVNPTNNFIAEHSNGKLYGLVNFNNISSGIIFEYDPVAGTYILKYSFGANGTYPNEGMVLHQNNKFYGTTLYGGNNGVGVLFEYDPTSNIYTKLFDFSSSTGASPLSAVTTAPNGKIYGTTTTGGANNLGTLFEYDPSTNIYIKKFDFGGLNGETPKAQLALVNNKLVGTAYAGGANNLGVIFEYDYTTNTFIKTFDFDNIKGKSPTFQLCLAQNGKLYGSMIGGANNLGVLIEYDPVSFSVIKKLDYSVSSGGPAWMIQLSNGFIYGTSGAQMYKYDIANNLATSEFTFYTAKNGSWPEGSFTQTSATMLTGLTWSGGSNSNAGVIFDYNINTNVYTKKFDLTSILGINPTGSLIKLNTKLYGMTNRGGTNNYGVIFEYDHNTNAYTKKHDFDSINGWFPIGDLLPITNNKLLGLTNKGGVNNKGVLFEYNLLSNTLTKKFDFGNLFGDYPKGKPVFGSNGKIYGTTSMGGQFNKGVIFEYDIANNNLSIKHNFNGATGEKPCPSLFLANNNKMYGATIAGGTNSLGVVFEYDPITNSYQSVASFTTGNLGFPTEPSLMQASNNKLYGLTSNGYFEYDYSLNTFSVTALGYCNTGGFASYFTVPLEPCSGAPTLTGSISGSTMSCVGNIYPVNFSIPSTNGPVNYVWSLPGGANIISGFGTNNITANFSALSIGNYSVSVFAENACGTSNTISSFSISVTSAQVPTINVNSGSICSGQSFTINPTGALSYTINGGNAIVSPTLSTSYLVAGTGTSGCVSSAIANVTVNFAPVISVSSGSLCAGQSFTINPSGANTYTYSSGTNIVSPAATSSYSVIGTSTNGCTSSNTAVSTIMVNPLPTISVNSGSICSGNAFLINAFGASTYTFSSGTNFVFPPVTTSYSVTGTSSLGCVSANTAIATVSVQPSVTLSIVGSTLACYGQPFNLTANGATTYTWNTGATTSIISHTLAINSSYNVIGESGGCSASAFIFITVVPGPTITATSNASIICAGQSVTLTSTGANTYTWNTSSTNTIIVVSPTINTIYSVAGTDLNGCITATPAIVNLSINALPLITATTNNSIICTGQSATLTATGANTYIWNTTSTNTAIVVSPTINTTYTVTGTDANGCNNFSIITQSVSLCTGAVTSNDVDTQRIIIYPNPTNSFFNIEINEYNSLTKVEVYNSIGQLIISKPVTVNVTNIDLSTFANGLYIVKVLNNNETISFSKIVKAN